MATRLTENRSSDEDRLTGGGVLHQEDIVSSPALRRLLAGGRILIGWTFLWAFIDKVIGLGFTTPSERAWINGGAPAQGFMKNLEGPTASFFANIAGPWADWLFMAGLLGIGIAMVAGAGLKIAAWSGTLLLAFMYLAQLPIGQAGMGFTNPVTDSHWIEAALLLVSAYGLAGDTWGLGRWWSRIVGNSWLR